MALEAPCDDSENVFTNGHLERIIVTSTLQKDKKKVCQGQEYKSFPPLSLSLSLSLSGLSVCMSYFWALEYKLPSCRVSICHLAQFGLEFQQLRELWLDLWEIKQNFIINVLTYLQYSPTKEQHKIRKVKIASNTLMD